MTSPARSLTLVQTNAVGYLEEIKAGTAQRVRQDEHYARLAEVVFAYWQAKLNHPKAWLDDKRERFIVRRLRETKGNWGLLLYAIDGALKNDYIMGRTDRNDTKYDRISTIFRDLEQVETLAEQCPKFRAGQEHPLVLKYQHTGNGNGTNTAG
jgi:hypothetical protein